MLLVLGWPATDERICRQHRHTRRPEHALVATFCATVEWVAARNPAT